MAELLGRSAQSPVEQSEPESPATRKLLNTIERAERPEPQFFGEFPAEKTELTEIDPRTSRQNYVREAPASTTPEKTVETIRISRDRLRLQGMIEPEGQRSPVAECFRLVKSQLLRNWANANMEVAANVIMVTSSVAGEGKTFCATNLAISLAQERDYSVLLVDADVILPSIPAVFGIEPERGLMDLLVDHSLDIADVLCKTDIGKLTILPSGNAHQHSTELLASDRMRILIKEMAKRYKNRIVIFDSPPMLAASEASVLASHMGQIIVVVEAGKTTKETLKTAVDRIDSGKIVNLLLNKGESRGTGYYYGGYGA